MSHSNLYTTTFVKRMPLLGNKFSLVSVQSVRPFNRHPQTVSQVIWQDSLPEPVAYSTHCTETSLNRSSTKRAH